MKEGVGAAEGVAEEEGRVIGGVDTGGEAALGPEAGLGSAGEELGVGQLQARGVAPREVSCRGRAEARVAADGCDVDGAAVGGLDEDDVIKTNNSVAAALADLERGARQAPQVHPFSNQRSRRRKRAAGRGSVNCWLTQRRAREG